MSAAVTRADLEHFRHRVTERLGLHFDEDRVDFLADVVRQRALATDGADASSYLARLPAAGAGEWRKLAELLTVGETYFFRGPEQLSAFAELFSSERRRPLRILSAGCASGEEAYSIAIVLRERFPELAPGDIRIVGIDVNAAALERARTGVYSSWSLRQTPPGLWLRHFERDGRNSRLAADIRSLVSFEERNLVSGDPHFWHENAFDAIFCRNVVMYFSPDATRHVIARLASALVAGGYLFLGHAETLRGVTHDFHLRHSHDTFYYQLRDRTGVEAASPSSAPWSLPDLGASTSWVAAIQQASDRIAALTRAPGSGRLDPDESAPDGHRPAPTSTPSQLARAVELMRREQFAEALSLVRGLPPELAADPDAELLHAVLLTNTGDRVEAERICQHVLGVDELNAIAHYLMALCREHAGDPSSAVHHDQAAAYLDPGFAMPHLHLGLIARRAGDPDTARRELAEAMALLPREDAARVVLLGGGFSREALMALCRAELRTAGGAP